MSTSPCSKLQRCRSQCNKKIQYPFSCWVPSTRPAHCHPECFSKWVSACTSFTIQLAFHLQLSQQCHVMACHLQPPLSKRIIPGHVELIGLIKPLHFWSKKCGSQTYAMSGKALFFRNRVWPFPISATVGLKTFAPMAVRFYMWLMFSYVQLAVYLV